MLQASRAPPVALLRLQAWHDKHIICNAYEIPFLSYYDEDLLMMCLRPRLLLAELNWFKQLSGLNRYLWCTALQTEPHCCFKIACLQCSSRLECPCRWVTAGALYIKAMNAIYAVSACEPVPHFLF